MSQRQEISFSEFLAKFFQSSKKVKSKLKKIIFLSLMPGCFAFLYALYIPVRYESKLVFSIQDSQDGYNGLASIAGQFGFDVGSQGGSNLFSSENIIKFLTSESLIREVLVSKFDSSKNEILANHYMEITGLRKKWMEKLSLNNLDLKNTNQEISKRLKDSLLQKIALNILKNELTVQKQDKKSSFVEINVSMEDENLSQAFSQQLIAVATSRYLNSRLKIKILNLERLENKADSILFILNKESASSAALRQQTVDLNPANKMALISSEITERDKMLLTSLYAEVVKNLELSRTLLTQETPVLEIVDNTTLPLRTIEINKYFAFLISFTASFFFLFVYYLIRLWKY